MISRYRWVLIGLWAGAGCVAGDVTGGVPGEEIGRGGARRAGGLNDRLAACAADPRVVAGTVSVELCVGANVFLREDFGGNGRTCATCHRVDDNFTIDPAFISKLPPSDPLFVAEFDPDLAGLEIPAQMRSKGLI